MRDNSLESIVVNRCCPPHCKGAPQKPCVWQKCAMPDGSAWWYETGCDHKEYYDEIAYYFSEYKLCPYCGAPIARKDGTVERSTMDENGIVERGTMEFKVEQTIGWNPERFIWQHTEMDKLRQSQCMCRNCERMLADRCIKANALYNLAMLADVSFAVTKCATWKPLPK